MYPVIFVLFSLSFFSPISSSADDPCSSMVPQATNGGKLLPLDSLLMQYGYFQTQGTLPGQVSSSSGSLQFIPERISETSTAGILFVKGNLLLQTGDSYRPSMDRLRYRMWRRGYGSSALRFDLSGFWSRDDGKLCMTGYSSRWYNERRSSTHHAVLRLNFKSNSTIVSSLVNGTLESIDMWSNYFHPIYIFGYNQNYYRYNDTLTRRANEPCPGLGEEGGSSLSLGSNATMCSTLRSLGLWYELEYGSSCGSVNCNPLGKDLGDLPRFMGLNVVGCSDEGKLHMYLTFSNGTVYRSKPPFIPNMVLVGEGVWDGEKNQLCVVACRIMNSSTSLVESFVGDCNIRMSLGFRTTFNIRKRSDAVGEIWSEKNKNDSGYFDALSFRSAGRSVHFQSLKYEYTEIDSLSKTCNQQEDRVISEKNIYPNPALNVNDMRFGMYMKGSSTSNFTSGYFVPVFLGSRLFRRDYFRVASSTKSYSAQSRNSTQRLWNVSYAVGFTYLPNGKWLELLSFQSPNYHKYREIAAEGIYNSETGSLCMVGCRYLPPNLRNLSGKVDSYDCEISINVQFPPLNASSDVHFSGTMKSMRNQSEPLYFEALSIFSLVPYVEESVRISKRIDFEIVMVLISLTLTCVFIGSQLFYAKRHPESLPSVAISMLAILILGLMIPLVLNFEALFVRNIDKKNVLLWSGGWLEANEVVVRVLTMVAFLLQFWLLQLTVSAKLAEQQNWQSSEWSVLKCCIPLYLIGGLIALLLHLIKTYGTSTPYLHHSLWEYLLSYAGLVLDGFLLPQVLFNLFSDAKGKTLARSFYVGMTLVRALPHAYDTYRSRNYAPRRFGSSYMYADPQRDFYSSSWDVVIPCGGIVLSVIIFVQQKSGGAGIVPRKFRRFAGYEQVPVVAGIGSTAEVELQ